MVEEYPFVTAMIVVRNEEQYVGRAVQSFLDQDYPKDRMELLIIDGESTDGTLEVIKNTIERASDTCRISFYDNPKRILAAGWNIGIKNAQGEYVIRIDAHAEAHPELISTCVRLFKELGDAAVVGCAVETISVSACGRIIANIQSSPFGIGNSKSRCTLESGYVDTVPYGMYRKDLFDKVGLFNEEFVRNQDNDMHGRIRASGGKFYLYTGIKNIYHSRTSVKAMAKQAFGNGKWIMIGIKKSESKEGISVKHLVPFMFFLASVLLLIGAIFRKEFGILLLCMYALYIVCALLFASKKTKDPKEMLLMLGGFWIYHMSYGLGTFLGMFSRLQT